MVDDDRTHYDMLGLEPDAGKSEIKQAYQEHLAAAQGAGDTETVLRIRRAWQVLSDPTQRGRYDDTIGVRRGARPAVADRPSANGSSDAVEIDDEEYEDDDEEYEDADDPEPAGEVEVARDWRGRPRPDRPRREMPPPPPIAEGLELPTIGRRLTGDLIDVVTVIAVGLGIGVALAAGIDDKDAQSAAGAAVFFVLITLYFIIPVMRTGQTLGKRMTYTMVVERETGALPAPRQVLIRYAIPGIMALTGSILAPVAIILGFSYAFGRDQISLLDRLAKTVVVVARYRPTRDA